MNDRTTPSIRVLRFWTEYDPDPSGSGEMRGRDKVEWAKIGDSTGASTVALIAQLAPKPPKRPAALEWQVVEPAYKAWKANQEIPETGTPLAAWPGADHGLVEALKKVNVKTVEDFAAVPDHALAGIPIPDLRRRKKAAEDFLLAQGDVSRVQAELSERDARLERQEREMAEMRDQIAALVAAQPKTEKRKAA